MLNAVSVEKVLRIVYQPQAIFRIRPVNRCSATIAGNFHCLSFCLSSLVQEMNLVVPSFYDLILLRISVNSKLWFLKGILLKYKMV